MWRCYCYHCGVVIEAIVALLFLHCVIVIVLLCHCHCVIVLLSLFIVSLSLFIVSLSLWSPNIVVIVYNIVTRVILRCNSPAAPSTNEKIATECCHRNSEISPARCSGGVKCIGLSLQVRAFLCPFDGCSSADLQFGSQTRICEKSVQCRL